MRFLATNPGFFKGGTFSSGKLTLAFGMGENPFPGVPSKIAGDLIGVWKTSGLGKPWDSSVASGPEE